MKNILFPLHTFEYKYRRMPEIISGYTTEQKVVTVANNDTSINETIVEEAEDSWLVSSLIYSGSDIIILFTRTIIAAA